MLGAAAHESASKLITVFISYSHADRRFLDRLHVFLKPLERERFIDWWDDTRITPGDDWRKAIKDALDTTQVALLMLSPERGM